MRGLRIVAVLLAITSGTLAYLLVMEFNPFIRRCNPDVCQNYALSAFKVHSVMHAAAGSCDFGVLPGFLSLNVMKPPGERWQTAVPSCRLKNLLAPRAPVGRVRVLLLGDSVDAHLAAAWCTLLQQPLTSTSTGLRGSVASALAAAVKAASTQHAAISSLAGNASGAANATQGPGAADAPGAAADPHTCCKDRDLLYFCKPPAGKPAGGATASVSVAMFHILGVHLDGPYHTGAKGSFLTRVPAALKQFNASLGGPPDLVLVHSNFWDQTRMWEQQEPGYGQLNKLMPDVVFSFSSNFSLLLSTTREFLPEDTLLATRTAAFPAFAANWLGSWHYIHQLNMAAAEVTRLHGLPVLDLGGMVFGLEPRTYLDDQHHPSKVVLLEVANIALNLLQQQRKRVASDRRAAAAQRASPEQAPAAGGQQGKPDAAQPAPAAAAQRQAKGGSSGGGGGGGGGGGAPAPQEALPQRPKPEAG